jgi:hypothetical protein
MTGAASIVDGADAADLGMMQLAIALAREAMALGEVPVGSVVTYRGRLIAQAFNLRETLQDPTAHAERLALTLPDVRRGNRAGPAQPCGLWRRRPQGGSLPEPLPPGRRPATESPGHDRDRSSGGGVWSVAEGVFPRPARKSSLKESPRFGGVPEWLKGPVSKTGVPLRGTEGSNPSSSAILSRQGRRTNNDRPRAIRGFRALPTIPLGLKRIASDGSWHRSDPSLRRTARA